MTPDEFRMPETKKPFRDYLKSLPPERAFAPGACYECFFCHFAHSQLTPAPGRWASIVFMWDTYRVGSGDGFLAKERPLPEWAKKFTADASRAVRDAIFNPRALGSKLNVAQALKVLSKC